LSALSRNPPIQTAKNSAVGLRAAQRNKPRGPPLAALTTQSDARLSQGSPTGGLFRFQHKPVTRCRSIPTPRSTPPILRNGGNSATCRAPSSNQTHRRPIRHPATPPKRRDRRLVRSGRRRLSERLDPPRQSQRASSATKRTAGAKPATQRCQSRHVQSARGAFRSLRSLLVTDPGKPRRRNGLGSANLSVP
jgi:hypothetical protein